MVHDDAFRQRIKVLTGGKDLSSEMKIFKENVLAISTIHELVDYVGKASLSSKKTQIVKQRAQELIKDYSMDECNESYCSFLNEKLDQVFEEKANEIYDVLDTSRFSIRQLQDLEDKFYHFDSIKTKHDQRILDRVKDQNNDKKNFIVLAEVYCICPDEKKDELEQRLLNVMKALPIDELFIDPHVNGYGVYKNILDEYLLSKDGKKRLWAIFADTNDLIPFVRLVEKAHIPRNCSDIWNYIFGERDSDGKLNTMLNKEPDIAKLFLAYKAGQGRCDGNILNNFKKRLKNIDQMTDIVSLIEWYQVVYSHDSDTRDRQNAVTEHYEKIALRIRTLLKGKKYLEVVINKLRQDKYFDNYNKIFQKSLFALVRNLNFKKLDRDWFMYVSDPSIMKFLDSKTCDELIKKAEGWKR